VFAAEKWNRIVVDLKDQSVSPADPVVNTASGTDVAITIQDDGKVVSPEKARFKFPRVVYERVSDNGGPEMLRAVKDLTGVDVRSASLSLNFRGCHALTRDYGIRDPDNLCPAIVVIVSNRDEQKNEVEAASVATVYSDNDGIEVLAASIKDGTSTQIPVLIGVVKRRAGLSYSAGLSFFQKSDERWTLRAIPDNNDEQKLVQLHNAPNNYKLAANANYLGLFGPPAAGLSFGVASDVPLENLSVTSGLTYTIRTLPLANSANITFGVSYAPRKVLLPEYRGLPTVPKGIAASALTSDEHAFGWFLGVSFNFAGGEDQFKTVFSGSGKKKSDEQQGQ